MKHRARQDLCRPLFNLLKFSNLYPNAWNQADSFRQDREELGDWPVWCFLPLAGWHAIISGGIGQVPLSRGVDIGRLGALGAWRVTQGIYRFDQNVFEEIAHTPLDGDIPHEILMRMPEWCVYIETPGMILGKDILYGFFAHMEWDANDGRYELRLVLDSENSLLPIPLHLGPWSLKESVIKMLEESDKYKLKKLHEISRTDEVGALSNLVEPLVSLLLYLCSQNAEIGDGKVLPSNPLPKRTKRGLRMFSPNKPTVWNVGVRMGAALKSVGSHNEFAQGECHSRQRPHIRRAHWHGYRSGPMTNQNGMEIPTKERDFTLKWLPPTPINVTSYSDIVATIRPVKNQ